MWHEISSEKKLRRKRYFQVEGQMRHNSCRVYSIGGVGWRFLYGFIQNPPENTTQDKSKCV